MTENTWSRLDPKLARKLGEFIKLSDVTDQTGIGDVLRPLFEAGPRSVPELHEFLDSAEPFELRSTAIWLLGEIGDRRSSPHALARLMARADPRERIAAVSALGRLRGTAARRYLIEALNDHDPQVRASTAHALGSFYDDEDAESALISVIEDPGETSDVRGYAAEALGGSGRPETAIPVLVRALDDSDPSVRFWAVFGLSGLGDETVLPALRRIAASDSDVVEGYGTVAEEATDVIAAIEDRTTGDGDRSE